jgi:galactitol-specific phosphotransferase system IIC component
MELELYQRRFFTIRKIKIYENKVFYKSSKFGNESEINIPFEELTIFKESHILSNFYASLISGVLLLFSLVSIIYRNDKDFDADIWKVWTIAFIIGTIFYFITRENLWKIKVQNNTYLFILKNVPDKDEVNSFIQSLFDARNKYLRETYSELNRNVSYEKQLNNLQWLKKIEAIKKVEFEKKSEELNSLFNLEKNVIGFTK